MVIPSMPRRWFLAVGLQRLLLCFFIGVAIIPVLFLGTWVYDNALKSEIQAVDEKHYLLAENVSGSLSMYAKDLAAFFIAKSEVEPAPFSEEIQTLLRSANIQAVALIEAGKPDAYCMGDASFFPAGGIDSLTTERRRAMAQPGQVIYSPLIFSARQEPTLYLLRLTSDRRLAVASVNTQYFKQLQASIVFGEGGHAAIVDAKGQAIAHPLADWENTAKDMSDLKPMALMMAEGRGVVRFYSPAVNTEMIAGYAVVPETGWGVMIPQPYSELQARARKTKLVAFGISGLGLLLAIFVSWRLTVYILGPIKSVIQAARALEAGQPTDELTVSRHMVPRELYDLLRAFGQMASEVSQVRATLEHRVEERTRELVKEVERRQQLEKQLIQQATHDILTGLPNRRLLKERLQAVLALSQRSHQTIALLFLDLDGFKQVNDTYGHQVGDELLVQVAARLQANLRKGDSVFRLGGDEFVILVEQISGEQKAWQLAQKILRTLQEPFISQGYQVCIGSSIGIKVARGGGHETADKMLADADSAMYQAKQSGNCAIVHQNILATG